MARILSRPAPALFIRFSFHPQILLYCRSLTFLCLKPSHGVLDAPLLSFQVSCLRAFLPRHLASPLRLQRTHLPEATSFVCVAPSHSLPLAREVVTALRASQSKQQRSQ